MFTESKKKKNCMSLHTEKKTRIMMKLLYSVPAGGNVTILFEPSCLEKSSLLILLFNLLLSFEL